MIQVLFDSSYISERLKKKKKRMESLTYISDWR